MKYFVVSSFIIGYLYLVVSGTADQTLTSTENVETSFSNTTNVEELTSNGTNLAESSKNAPDLEVSLQESFPYTIKNETEPILEHGIKSRIKGGFNKVKGGFNKVKGGFNKVKTKITNIGNKVKNKIKGIGSGGGGSGGGGSGSGGGSSNYHYRYRKTTGTYSNLDTSTTLYIVFGVIGGVILISVICYIVGR